MPNTIVSSWLEKICCYNKNDKHDQEHIHFWNVKIHIYDIIKKVNINWLQIWSPTTYDF